MDVGISKNPYFKIKKMKTIITIFNKRPYIIKAVL